MKLHLKRTSLLVSSLLIGGKLFAQSPDSIATATYVKPFSPASSFRTWSIGVYGASVSSYTPFQGKEDWHTQKVNFGYGAYIKDQIWHSFGIQGNFFRGQIEGTDPALGTPYNRFKTDINYAADLSAVITLANISWSNQKGGMQPYLTAGGGFAGYKPTLYNAAGTATPGYRNGENISEFYIPVGVGLKFNVGSGVNIDLGYQVNFMHSDNLDGYTTGGNYDQFSYGHIGLEFALGKKSKPQLATHNPVASMRTEYTMKEIALQNQIEAERAKNDRLRSDLNTTNANLAATNANLAKFTMDSDNDGVPDFFDKCPNTPAGTKVDGAGCPLPIAKPDVKVYVTEADKKVVKDAIKNLEFDFGKATIRPVSFPSLDRVADLLVSKNFSLKLAGHTDNVGSDEANMKLSKDRAESIKSYLVSKGANASRIEATGYGETQPIATNKTANGRQQNRRVEFTLF
ncbi:MAG: OmpA family protein [Bacteroidota bacterium]